MKELSQSACSGSWQIPTIR